MEPLFAYPIIKYNLMYIIPPRKGEMFSTLAGSGMILYGIIQVLVAFIAVVLALKWKKFEFLVGLFFLLLYAIIEVVDVFFFTIMQSVFIDIAQYGFILLAIIFFIIGMHPSWAARLAPYAREHPPEEKLSHSESEFSQVKKYNKTRSRRMFFFEILKRHVIWNRSRSTGITHKRYTE